MSTKANYRLEKKMSVKNSNSSSNNNKSHENKKVLITVNVVGSSGPMRLVVNEDDTVGAVIGTALRCYAKEGRLPIMGTDADQVLLYSANFDSDALSPSAQIGSQGSRTFMLCKKQRKLPITETKASSDLIPPKGVGCWKSLLNNPFTSFKLLSH